MGSLELVVGLLITLLVWGTTIQGAGSEEMTAPLVQPPYPTPMPAVAPAPDFVDGVHIVGVNGVAPGTYRSSEGQEECYWARLSGLSGSKTAIASKQVAEHGAVATILPSDAGFESRGCGVWSEVALPEVRSNYTWYSGEVDDGLHVVGEDIAPGTYRATNPQDSCRWARLASFARPDDAIDSGPRVAGDVVVTIGFTDVGFESTGCGKWHSLGFNNCRELQAVVPEPEGFERGHPIYRDWLDDDGDGIACEADN